ncbi:hypothetical protein AAE478_001173 [Parahypoxylon ruwenzoriense]
MPAVVPVPPFVEIPGVLNFRDLGSHFSDRGGAIRQGLVFRSAEPSKATHEGVSRLRQLGIKHIYDLRSPPELLSLPGKAAPVKEWEGIERISVPVFRDQDYSPEAVIKRNMHFSDGPKGFANAYMDILDAASSLSNKDQPFANILSHLASDNPTPLLIHCSAGKDRTGVICALILELCGAPDSDIAYEYSLTNLGLKDLHEIIIQSLMKEDLFAANPEGARRMVRAE